MHLITLYSHHSDRCVFRPALALFLGLILVPRASPGQRLVEVNVHKTVPVSVTLPKLKTRLKPLDGEVRVALVLPMPRDEPSAYLVTVPSNGPISQHRWYTAAQVKEVPKGPLTAEHYKIVLTLPFSERLSEIVQQFFPERCSIGKEMSRAPKKFSSARR
jgi:hypothetical protein